VDIGFGPAISDPPPARDVQVIKAVEVNSYFKAPIGYFFIDGLSVSQLASLLSAALEKIHETGARAISLTCDSPSIHFAMLQSLGASLSPDNTYLLLSIKIKFKMSVCPYKSPKSERGVGG